MKRIGIAFILFVAILCIAAGFSQHTIVDTDILTVTDTDHKDHKVYWSSVDTFIGNSTSLSNILDGTTTLTAPAATDLSVSDSLYATKTVSPNISDGTATLTGGNLTGLNGVLGEWVTLIDSIDVVDSTLYFYTHIDTFVYRGSVDLDKQ